MILGGLYAQIKATPAVVSLLAPEQAQTPYSGIYFSRAAKGAPMPYVVLHVVSAPPAESSTDGVSELIEAELQFDSYADNAVDASTLSHAVRDLFKNFAGVLPDGTSIQFTDVLMDVEDPYEEGGTGYVERSLLRLKAFYTEAA